MATVSDSNQAPLTLESYRPAVLLWSVNRVGFYVLRCFQTKSKACVFDFNLAFANLKAVTA